MSSTVITPLRTVGRAPRVLTIDAEDWFHVCGDGYYSDPRRWDDFAPRVEATLGGLFDRLAQGGHRATVFFLGWVARRYPGLVRAAVEGGHEIGAHGDVHVRADEMSAEVFREDLQRCRKAIRDAGGPSAAAYRAAEWSIREPGAPALAGLAEAGVLCDASIMPVPPLGRATNRSGPYRVERDGWSIVEIPPLTGLVFGRRLPLGGAWPFRLLPEARLAEAESAFRDRGEPAVFTLHPWELDREHPPMDGLPALTRVVHFLGLRGFPARLDRWLDRDRCVPLGDVVPLLRPA